MKYVFVLDESKCIACGACAVACMDQNDIRPENGDTPFRSCFTGERGEGAETKFSFMSLACMHCENAPCVSACPTGCLRKDGETGFTIYDDANCIGCHSCAMACPFAEPCFNGGTGKMSKCDGCAERIRHGMKPACVKVCPFGALQLMPKDEYTELMRTAARRKVSYAILED